VTRPEQPSSIAADLTATDRIPHPFQGRRRSWAAAAASLLVVASGLASRQLALGKHQGEIGVSYIGAHGSPVPAIRLPRRAFTR
jgi:hypothetical protein